MRISVDDQVLFTLSETQKKVIKNDIPFEIFEDDMRRRLHYILTHKYERCFQRLKQEWTPKLSSKMASLPTDPDQFSELVFSQPEYKCRSTRDKENTEGK